MKSNVDNFDVPMGAYDSAQSADLIGIYILDTLSRIVNLEQMGLYRDGGIIFIPDCNSPKTSKTHKKLLGRLNSWTKNWKSLELENDLFPWRYT